MKKIPMRTCLITGEKLEKKDLIRVVRTPEGSVILDTTVKANVRGAYLKKDITVIDKSKKSGILNKKLEVTVPDSIYEELKNVVGD